METADTSGGWVVESTFLCFHCRVLSQQNSYDEEATAELALTNPLHDYKRPRETRLAERVLGSSGGPYLNTERPYTVNHGAMDTNTSNSFFQNSAHPTNPAAFYIFIIVFFSN